MEEGRGLFSVALGTETNTGECSWGAEPLWHRSLHCHQQQRLAGSGGRTRARAAWGLNTDRWLAACGGFLCKSQKYLERLCGRLKPSYEHVGEQEQELRVIYMNVTKLLPRLVRPGGEVILHVSCTGAPDSLLREKYPHRGTENSLVK